MTTLLLQLILVFAAGWLSNGHGYLKSPRARNLVAFEETVWWPQTDKDPQPETCPHCLNRGGSLARCGLTDDNGGIRNYDTPRNALLGQMPTKIQAEYTQGQDVVLDVTLTAHHKGHFVFSACPISPGEIPTQECFDANQLTFVEDLLHGANYDPNYPGRAYIAPVNDPNYIPDIGSAQGVMYYSFKMRLPPDLYGDLVLIQWYYLTANSCFHEGYYEYDWPDSWNIDATSSGLCGEVSSDGTGVPEQFWNCAEVKIRRNLNQASVPSPTPPANQPNPVVEISSSISIPIGLPSQDDRPSSAGSHGKTIVGYYASWQWYDRNKKAAPANMDFTKVQRVNFAFFQIDVQGNMWGTDAWADPNLLFGPYNWNPSPGSKEYCSWDSATVKACNYHNYEQGLIHLVHAAGAEIYPSLGGWTLSDPFPAMAASQSARATFSQNCVDLIKAYDFDGIDIDWEYPGFASHSGTPQDRENFKLLLDDVRRKLDDLGSQTGKFYGLTATLPCGPQHIANMDIAHVASTLSELNLMTYDFHGAFSSVTGTNAPLYYQGWGEDDFDVHSCVENWLAAGGSRNKINIGLPFYGRSFGGATGLNQPHTGADQVKWGIDDGTPQYFNIVAQLPYMESIWDKTTWTQYAYFGDGGLVSFDNENAICAKVQYAQEHNLGGFIIWELSGDLMDDLSTPLLDVTNKKLLNPDFNCGEPGFHPEGIDSPTPAIFVPAPPSNPTPVTYPAPANPAPVTYPTPYKPTFPATPANSEPSEPSASSFYFPTTPNTPDAPENSNPSEPVLNPSPNEPAQYTQQQVAPAPENPTPITYPTPYKPTFPATPVNYEPSEPSILDPSFYFPTTPNTPDAPEISNPSEPVLNPSLNEPAPYTQQQVANTPVVLLCGDQQVASDIDDTKAMDLFFSYELHVPSSVPVNDALKDIKGSLLNGLSGKLNCAAGGSNIERMLRGSTLEASQETIVSIEASQLDLLQAGTPCTIPLSIDGTLCHSVIGSIRAHVDKGTPATTLSTVSDELLFYIRTSMASGIFESIKVRKAIFIKNLSPSPLQNQPTTNIIWEQQSKEGNSSTIIAIIMSLMVVLLVGILLCLIVRRKKQSEYYYSEQAKNDIEIVGFKRQSAPTNSTEEAINNAIDTDQVWKNALNLYGEKSTYLDIDPEEDLHVEQVSKEEKGNNIVSQSKPQNDNYKASLEPKEGQKGEEGQEGHPSIVLKANQDDSFDEIKKKSKMKKKKQKSDMQDEEEPIDSKDKIVFSPDVIAKDDQDHLKNHQSETFMVEHKAPEAVAVEKEQDGKGEEESDVEASAGQASSIVGKANPPCVEEEHKCSTATDKENEDDHTTLDNAKDPEGNITEGNITVDSEGNITVDYTSDEAPDCEDPPCKSDALHERPPSADDLD